MQILDYEQFEDMELASKSKSEYGIIKVKITDSQISW